MPQSERAIAKALGLKHYSTGKPCAQGHVAPRFTGKGSCTECLRQSVRSRYQKDPEKWRKHGADGAKKWRAENLEKSNANIRRWQESNADRVRAYKHAYKSRRRSMEIGGASWREVEAWRHSQKKVCYWCQADCADSYHVDHYQPLSKGGTHQINNLVIACPSCNLKKNAKDPYLFAAEVGRLF